MTTSSRHASVGSNLRGSQKDDTCPHRHNRPRFARAFVTLALCLVMSCVWAPAGSAGEARPHVPGEFEPQKAILLGGGEMSLTMPELLADIAKQTEGKIDVVVMVNDRNEQALALGAVYMHPGPRGHVRYLKVPHDTMWARDYGPFVVTGANGPALVDACYDQDLRPLDDKVPAVLANKLKLPLITTKLRLDGGNLLLNGKGVAICTQDLIQTNIDEGRFDEAGARAELERVFGIKQLIELTPLRREPTGHVDMFATFVSANTVVVGQYTKEQDKKNAKILNNNAKLLANTRLPDGSKLHVVRVPMPRRTDGHWRSFTNVVYANGVLLMPAFPATDPLGTERARQTFARLLPGWRIAPIDVEALSECGGALHCVAMNLGPVKGKFIAPPAPPVILQPAKHPEKPRLIVSAENIADVPAPTTARQ